MQLNSAGTKLYSSFPGATVSLTRHGVNAADGTLSLEDTRVFGPGQSALGFVLDPDDTFLYVQELGLGAIFTINASDFSTVGSPVPYGHLDKLDMVFHPGGNFFYGARTGQFDLYRFPVSGGSVGTPVLVDATCPSAAIGAIAMHPTGSYLVVGCTGTVDNVIVFGIDQNTGVLTRIAADANGSTISQIIFR